MPPNTVRRLLFALVLPSMPMLALTAPIDLTCKWTHPKNPSRTENLTLTVDGTASTVTISRGTTNSVAFSAAEIRFNARTASGWDWKYVLNRTTLVLTETNHTASGAPIDYVCILVDRKV
jgi:hypothetical protein